ncbi:hypothetical protein OK016_29430 [Vibrio chagasii]|nr:hypothetical protein [Vibrio chagasii]
MLPRYALNLIPLLLFEDEIVGFRSIKTPFSPADRIVGDLRYVLFNDADDLELSCRSERRKAVQFEIEDNISAFV